MRHGLTTSSVPISPVVERELTAYARDHIAHLKVPRESHYRDELPRTPTGKMVKGTLREEYVG